MRIPLVPLPRTPRPSRRFVVRGTARRGGALYFIGVVTAAFAIMVSIMALGIGKASQQAAASKPAHATAPLLAPEKAAGGTAPTGGTAWIGQTWAQRADEHATVERGGTAAIRNAGHLRHLTHLEHLRHLAHLAYLRRLAAYQATGEKASTSATAFAAPAASTRARVAVDWALRQVGVPYLWGGTGNGGFDCSGLVMSAWAAAGVQLPRTSYAQADAGPRISRDQLQPGDLVFTNGFGHVQMYVGGRQVVQAPAPGGRVEVTALPPTGYVDAYVRVPAR